MNRRIRIVDVFTEESLSGNQLAVVLDGQGMTPAMMQRFAREMNFSETTFVMPPDDRAHAARVRIFSPATEMPFAGHPTIGTAWVLATEGVVTATEFTLEENVGPVRVRAVRQKGRLSIWMKHPPLQWGATFDRAEVARVIGLTEADLMPSIAPQMASTGVPFVYVALRDKSAVDRAISERARLEAFASDPAYGVMMFAVDGANRLYTRVFSVDIPEDPATGSGSGPLGAFAVKHGLVPRAAEVKLVSEQGTKLGRRSLINIELEYGATGDLPSRIEIGGSVMPVLEGTTADF